jgi:uncharacterized damage-inducible protein DinB
LVCRDDERPGGEAKVRDPRIEYVLKVLDPPPGVRPWHGGATPLGSLRGVDERLAAWRPGPGRHGIWELVLHMAYWKYAVRRRLTDEPTGRFPRSPSNWPAVRERTSARAWEEDRALLRDEHVRLVEAIRGFDPARLDGPTGTGSGASVTYGDLVMGIVMHDTYHTGQIQVLKRLFASGR